MSTASVVDTVPESTRSVLDLPDSGASGTNSFRRDVQGLRALAVFLVVLAHARIARFAGGYIGVDVFFVISGYVITGLLTREGGRGVGHKLSCFYARRIRRILPAATLALIATLIATYHWLGDLSGRNLAVDERWASLFAANWRFIDVKTNYLQSLQPPSVILHFWSLAVEEQFYLVFPVVVFGIWAVAPVRYRRSALVALSVVVIIISAVWCAIQTNSDPVAAYYSPFTRFWELSLGALIAVLPDSFQVPSQALKAAAGWIALTVIVASAVFFTDKTSYPGVAVWWPVGATAIILLVGRDRSGIGPELLLETRTANFVGDISYSLYLWHFPILMIPMQYSVTGNISVTSRLELIAASVLIATISYYLVENPLRRYKPLADKTAVTFLMGAALIATIWLATGLPHLLAP